MLKAPDAAQRPQKHVLHDIFGVGRAARLAWQAAVRPSTHRRQRPLDEDSSRCVVSVLRSLQNVKRGIPHRIVAIALRHGAAAPVRFKTCACTRTEDNEAR